MLMRITKHPILSFNNNKKVKFTFNNKELYGLEGEPIIVALRANGILKTRVSAKDHKPLSAFCMQGRCASCMMNIDGNPNTMACVTPLKENMLVFYQGTDLDTETFKVIPEKGFDFLSTKNKVHPECDIAIIGAGPAGLKAAIAAAEAKVNSIIILDDKAYIGGQLKLQTHNFFGTKALGAGKRGFTIASELGAKLNKYSNITIKLNSTVIGYYPPNVLAYKDEGALNFLKAKKIILATGASEKTLAFENNYLPGVLGAGAAQTYMNLYGVKPGQDALIIGGGNIGVILAYQMIQAGINVKGIVEASSKFGAYKVHLDKIKALGVATFLNHTILKAVKDENKDSISSAIICELDKDFNIITNTEKNIKCDLICLAVGLNPLNELLWQANCEFKYVNELGEVPVFNEYRNTTNPDVFVAGDAAVIGEASIAMLEGEIAGLKASYDINFIHPDYNNRINNAFTMLDKIEAGTYGERLKHGKNFLFNKKTSTFNTNKYCQTLKAEDFKSNEAKAYINCTEDIPCNPCEALCPYNAIIIGEKIIQEPSIDLNKCIGCGLCIDACPGRAIILVQYNYDTNYSKISLPYEFLPEPEINSKVELLDSNGTFICNGNVLKTKNFNNTKCNVVEVLVLKEFAFKVKNIKNQNKTLFLEFIKKENKDKNYVCRCEEVTYEEVLNLIDSGYKNINELRRVARIGMGPCRGVQCRTLLENILKRYANISNEEILEAKNKRRTIFRSPVKRITLGEAAKLNFSVSEINEIHSTQKNKTIPLEVLDNFKKNSIDIKSSINKKTVIIGGGIAGVCTAYELAKLGQDGIIVIEKEFLSAGASSAALGGIRTGFTNSNKIKRATYGLNFYKNFNKIFTKDIGWYQGGYVYLAYDDETDTSFKNTLKTWKENNVEAIYLNNYNDILKYVPGLYKDKNLISAVFFPQAGGANPFTSTFYTAELAKKIGVEFLISEVADILVSNNSVEAVITKDGTKINCDTIINCAGSFAVQVSNMVGISLHNIVKIARHESLITEKMPLWLDPLIVNYHPSLSGYWQQKRNINNLEGEIVACFTPSIPLYGYNTNSDIYCLSRMAQSILLSQPGLQNIGIIRSYAHHYVGTDSGIALIGPSKVKGFWQNIAKKGHGYMCAPGDAHAIASSIVNNNIHTWIDDCNLNQSSIEQML